MKSIIFTDCHDPSGRTIRYNVDVDTRTAAAEVRDCIEGTDMLEIPNEDGGDPIFLNPERVASITPAKED